MKKKLIVNADDYGHTAGISLGIRQAHLNGIVTSTSVMMNRPDALNAIQIARQDTPNLGLGVHLVLTTGKPLLPANQVSSLVDENGSFYKINPFIERLREFNIKQVEAEWRAQINTFVSVAGFKPDHLDSHHHSSYFTPALFDLMIRLADELDCAIRMPLGVEETLFGEGVIPVEYQHRMPPCPQVFIGDFYDEGATLETLVSMVKSIVNDAEHETFELMCHPAVVDDEVRQATGYTDQREIELSLLQNRDIHDLLSKNQIKLCRFSDL